MLIQLSGRFIIDPVQFPHRLVVELDVGDFTGESHPECGIFSGRHDGFEEPEEMNQRMPEIPTEEGSGIRWFEIRAPRNRAPLHQRRGYHYVAIGWHDHVYVAYPLPTEIVLEDSEGSWSVAVGWGNGVTVLMPDYSPWDQP
jgi:hypothetical protein